MKYFYASIDLVLNKMFKSDEDAWDVRFVLHWIDLRELRPIINKNNILFKVLIRSGGGRFPYI